MSETVAAAWATMAGWIRIRGQVTPVTTSIRSVEAAIAPMTLQTNELSPWRSIQGWKWSEIMAKSNPTSSARLAQRSSSLGACSSLERAYPIFMRGPRRAAGSALLLPLGRRGPPAFLRSVRGVRDLGRSLLRHALLPEPLVLLLVLDARSLVRHSMAPPVEGLRPDGFPVR